jgi:hypothetical protein
MYFFMKVIYKISLTRDQALEPLVWQKQEIRCQKTAKINLKCISVKWVVNYSTTTGSDKNSFVLNLNFHTCDHYSYIKYLTNIVHSLLFHVEFGSLVVY